MTLMEELRDNEFLLKEFIIDRNPSLDNEAIGKKVWWKCSKAECDHHVWEALIFDRIRRSSGCPFCVGKKWCSCESLEVKNPKIAKEWHPTKNGKITPKDIKFTSREKFWWLCSLETSCKFHPHEWEAIPEARTKKVKPTGCPFCCTNGCYGKKVCPCDQLFNKYPDTKDEWDFEKNKDIDYNNILSGSNIKVWWICKVCKHNFQRTVHYHTYYHNARCPNYTNHLLGKFEEKELDNEQIIEEKSIENKDQIFDEKNSENQTISDEDDQITNEEFDKYKVIINNKNYFITIRNVDYINVSQICKLYNKNIEEWLDMKESKNLLSECSIHNNISSENLLQKEKVDIFVHPDIALHISQWCEINMYIQINKIIRERFILKSDIKEKAAKLKYKKLERKHEELLTKRDCKYFTKGECFYICQNAEITKNRYKIGSSMDVGETIRHYRRNNPFTLLHCVLYTKKHILLESCIKTCYFDSFYPKNHEVLQGVKLKDLIDKVLEICKLLNIKYNRLPEEEIDIYNEYIYMTEREIVFEEDEDPDILIL